jgi:hypothetical protein
MCSWTKLAFSKNKFSPFKRHFSCKIYFGKTFPNIQSQKIVQLYDYILYIYMVHVHVYVCFIVFNTTFNNIPVLSWRSVFLVEETECTRSTFVNHNVITDKLYQIMLYCLSGIQIHNVSGDRWSVATVYINIYNWCCIFLCIQSKTVIRQKQQMIILQVNCTVLIFPSFITM